jgi:hypothetical protein
MSYINNNNKEKKMATAKKATQAPPVKLTAAQKAAEDRKAFVEWVQSMDLDEYEIEDLNKKLHIPIPIPVQKKTFHGFYVNVSTDLSWADAAYTGGDGWGDTSELTEELEFVKHLEKALKDAVKSFKPKQGKLTFHDISVDLDEYTSYNID